MAAVNLSVKLENAYSRPFLGVFGPKLGENGNFVYFRRFVHRSSNDSSLTFKPWIRPWSRSCLYSITYLGWRNAVAIPSHCYRQPRSLRCVQEHGASPILRFTHHDHDRPSGGVAQPRTSLSEPTPLQWQFALRCRRQDDQIIYKSLISFSSMFS